MQTTEWSACSKSCGMGISARVTNNNPQCHLEKETRLCMVRPCDFPWEKAKVGLGGEVLVFRGLGFALCFHSLRALLPSGGSH